MAKQLTLDSYHSELIPRSESWKSSPLEVVTYRGRVLKVVQLGIGFCVQGLS